jgi:hypothetical protein
MNFLASPPKKSPAKLKNKPIQPTFAEKQAG